MTCSVNGIQVSRAGSDSSVLSAAGARSSPFPMSGFVADRWFAVGSGVVGAPLREHVVLPAEAAQRAATGASDNGASATRSGALSSAAGGGSDDASSVGATGLAQSDDMLSAASIAASAWKTPVRAILEYFVARTPGSFIAETDNVLSWNFRNSDADLAAWQSKELQLHLETTLTSAPLDVVSSEHAVNVCIRAGSIETALLHIVDHELLRDGGMPPIGFYFSAAASKGARRVSDALLAVRATLASLYPTLPGASGRGGPLPASSGEAGAGSSAAGMDAPPRGAAPACICVPRGLASSFESCGATFTCPTVAAVAQVLEKL
ncbi:MAG: hypothetical protein EOO41_04000 [Methanobacteriota archaeon]|nr:MAG: hypothetical protein EOO41_04000 [Euryarchaeota archaeon]